MIDWAAAYFGTGLAAAGELRTAVLHALGAEDEWLAWDEHEDTVSWITGPLATAFSVRPGSALTPGLGVLHVSTRCAWVEDLATAEALVSSLNRGTTVNRWIVRNRPHAPEGGATTAGADARRAVLQPLMDPSDDAAVHVELSVVTGDGLLDLPLAAVVAGVREQIAKATAVITSDGADQMWSTAVVTMAGRAREVDSWSAAVHHYEDAVIPVAEGDAEPLLRALTTVFAEVQSELITTGSALWVGTGDEIGLTCETPYGAGPFPEGLVGAGIPPDLRGDHNRTSLVQSSVIDHAQLGRGLMLTLRPWADPTEDSPDEAAALLNEQLSEGRSAEGAAHGWGAWIVDEYFMHVLFLPAAWATLLDEAELHQLMRCLLDDTARLSRVSRTVLERLCDAADEEDLLAGLVPVHGLAAGPESRGLSFGETGAGTDPGARLLARTWGALVAGDSQWAQLDVDDGVGFDYWPNEHRQRFRSTPCGDGGGALVTIETLLGAAAPPLGRRPFPGAVIQSEDGWALRTVLHVHDDSLSWLVGWCTPLAVSHAILASSIADASTAGLSAHPSLGSRPEPDQMLELFDEGSEWFESTANPLSQALMTFATSIPEPVPHGARVVQDDAIEIDWLLRRRGDPVTWSPATTLLQRYQDDDLGPCLLLRTGLELDGDREAWCAGANAWLAGKDVTSVGGFRAQDGAVSFTSLVPAALDRSAYLTGWISHVGTCLSHHLSAVADAALDLGGVTHRSVSADELADGLGALPDFYRGVGLTNDELEVQAVPDGDGTVIDVVVSRSVPAEQSDDGGWPRLGSVEVSDGQSTVLTRSSVDLSGDVMLGLRLVHSAIVQPDINRAHPDPYLARRTTGAVANFELEEALSAELDDGVLVVGDDGSLRVASHAARQVRLEYDGNAPHPIWGETPTVRGVVVGLRGEAPVETGLGSWAATEDGLAYTVSLPPFALGCVYPNRRVDMFRHAISEVAQVCESAAASDAGLIDGRGGTPVGELDGPTVSRPSRVVYGHYYLHQSFAFGDEDLMRAYAEEIRLIEGCETIGEAMSLRESLVHAWAPGVPESVEEMEDEGGALTDAYDARSTGAAADGDWPPMPTGFALDTFGDEDSEAWEMILGEDVGGCVVTTTLNGDYLLVPEDREEQLKTAFLRLGIAAVRDDHVIGSFEMR